MLLGEKYLNPKILYHKKGFPDLKMIDMGIIFIKLTEIRELKSSEESIKRLYLEVLRL